ncbi:Crp/Fnr family transcriptional regulator [Mesobacillus zeae]|uniref:Crp/Fnr family transcriptional regulator n=1 Tax=Mesobacillus zeae TaxID=1917180 RepID=A0A398BFH4_9BACI|nr:Crp/Fnr family transcriptional regulator [Mesobacillus zeae]RID88772.1 Crp/Fnr family transcriptional regulator [Mesobacillus zeae]
MLPCDTVFDLSKFDIFSSLPEKMIEKFKPYVFSRTYKKNQYLFMEGDPRDKIFFLIEGYVMFEIGNEQGSMLYLDFVKHDQMFPLAGVFTDKYYQHTAIAVTDIKVYFIQAHVLEDLAKSNPKLLMNIINRLSGIISLHQKRVQKIVIPNAQDRVLHSLQFLMEDLGEKDGTEIVIPCPLTASKISRISGTTRETVSLLMNQLKKENIISVCAKKIRIHKPEYFEAAF